MRTVFTLPDSILEALLEKAIPESKNNKQEIIAAIKNIIPEIKKLDPELISGLIMNVLKRIAALNHDALKEPPLTWQQEVKDIVVEELLKAMAKKSESLSKSIQQMNLPLLISNGNALLGLIQSSKQEAAATASSTATVTPTSALSGIMMTYIQSEAGAEKIKKLAAPDLFQELPALKIAIDGKNPLSILKAIQAIPTAVRVEALNLIQAAASSAVNSPGATSSAESSSAATSSADNSFAPIITLLSKIPSEELNAVLDRTVDHLSTLTEGGTPDLKVIAKAIIQSTLGIIQDHKTVVEGQANNTAPQTAPSLLKFLSKAMKTLTADPSIQAKVITQISPSNPADSAVITDLLKGLGDQASPDKIFDVLKLIQTLTEGIAEEIMILPRFSRQNYPILLSSPSNCNGAKY